MIVADPEEIRILTEIKESLVLIDGKLEDIKDGLSSDRSWLWKILLVTIVGAFSLVGVKLVFP